MPAVANEGLSFVDSNIWVYAFVTESVPTRKGAVAQQLVARTGLAVSTQVINEVCCYLVVKARAEEARIVKHISAFYQSCCVVELNQPILLGASALRPRYSFSFWDSMIVAAALAVHARILYSEDMQDGLIVNGTLRIVNPFK